MELIWHIQSIMYIDNNINYEILNQVNDTF